MKNIEEIDDCLSGKTLVSVSISQIAHTNCGNCIRLWDLKVAKISTT